METRVAPFRVNDNPTQNEPHKPFHSENSLSTEEVKANGASYTIYYTPLKHLRKSEVMDKSYEPRAPPRRLKHLATCRPNMPDHGKELC